MSRICMHPRWSFFTLVVTIKSHPFLSCVPVYLLERHLLRLAHVIWHHFNEYDILVRARSAAPQLLSTDWQTTLYCGAANVVGVVRLHFCGRLDQFIYRSEYFWRPYPPSSSLLVLPLAHFLSYIGKNGTLPPLFDITYFLHNSGLASRSCTSLTRQYTREEFCMLAYKLVMMGRQSNQRVT